MNWADVRLCNCAVCSAPLLGESMPAGVELTAPYRVGRVAGRVDGRPYCGRCLTERQEEAAAAGAKK